MAKVTGFLEFDRIESKSINPKIRIKNFDEFILPYSKKTLNQQSSRCMNCGIPYCHNSCPVNNIIPDWNELVYEGEFYLIISQGLGICRFRFLSQEFS